MPVIYSGKKIIPGPFVTISKNYIESGGYLIGQTYQIKIIGKIVAYKGSPDSTGAFHTAPGYPADEVISGDSRLAAIERKIEAIKKLFKEEGHTLEWASDDGSTPLSCNPRIKGINFQEGPWHQTCDFTVDLEADQIYGLADPDDLDEFEVGDIAKATAKHIETYSETWSIKENWNDLNGSLTGTPIFEIVHTISAKGKRHFEPDGTKLKEPWEWAKDFCIARATYDGDTNLYQNTDVLANSALDSRLSPDTALRFVSRTEDVNESSGEYTYSETVIGSNGVGGFYVTGNMNVSSNRGQNGFSITVSGECQGLGKDIAERMEQAEKYLTDARILQIAQAHANGSYVADSYQITLNTSYLNKTITKDITRGSISFSYEYNDRHPHYLTDYYGNPSLSEDYNFSYSGGTPSVAEIFCLGRTLGPVFQDLGTKTTKQKTLTINALMRRSSGGFSSPPDVSAFITGYRPLQVDFAVTDYISNQTKSWNPTTGKFNFSITWNYE
jgi:hypothetical protein